MPSRRLWKVFCRLRVGNVHGLSTRTESGSLSTF
jgi:hypothetical protein